MKDKRGEAVNNYTRMTSIIWDCPEQTGIMDVQLILTKILKNFTHPRDSYILREDEETNLEEIFRVYSQYLWSAE